MRGCHAVPANRRGAAGRPVQMAVEAFDGVEVGLAAGAGGIDAEPGGGWVVVAVF